MNKVKLARLAIKNYLETGKKIKSVSQQPGACFVTLSNRGQLRGCIGKIEPVGSLGQAIIDNAISAATRDGRFELVSLEELKDLTIEVSILSLLTTIVPKSVKELLRRLQEEKPGLVIQKYGRKAIFLPQVWEEISSAEEFLRQLCLKAGLRPDDWQEGMRFWVFTVKKHAPPQGRQLKVFPEQKFKVES